MNYQLQLDTQNFYVRWNGKPNDNGPFKGECVNLIHSYFEEVLKIPRFVGNAIDYLNGVPGFTLIKSDGTNKPSFGDLVIFDYKPNGHIGLQNWTAGWLVNLMQQNDPIGSKCAYKVYDYHHIAGWLHWNGNQKPISVDVGPKMSTKFTLDYTVINGDPVLMEQARQLLLKYGKGKFDCQFSYVHLPPVVPLNGKVYTVDEQVLFLKNFPIATKFGFICYTSPLNQMTTAEIPTTSHICTFATPKQDPLFIVYELANAISISQGKFLPPDIYTPDEAFVQKRFDLLS